jgi:hypothetical protein
MAYAGIQGQCGSEREAQGIAAFHLDPVGMIHVQAAQADLDAAFERGDVLHLAADAEFLRLGNADAHFDFIAARKSG